MYCSIRASTGCFWLHECLDIPPLLIHWGRTGWTALGIFDIPSLFYNFFVIEMMCALDSLRPMIQSPGFHRSPVSATYRWISFVISLPIHSMFLHLLFLRLFFSVNSGRNRGWVVYDTHACLPWC